MKAWIIYSIMKDAIFSESEAIFRMIVYSYFFFFQMAAEEMAQN